jgi:hypothetical protein
MLATEEGGERVLVISMMVGGQVKSEPLSWPRKTWSMVPIRVALDLFCETGNYHCMDSNGVAD